MQTISFHCSSKKFGSDCEMLESVQTLVHGEFGDTLRACVNEGVTTKRETTPRRIDMKPIVSDMYRAGMLKSIIRRLRPDVGERKNRVRVATE